MPGWLRLSVILCAGALLLAPLIIWLGGGGPLPALADAPYLEPVLVYATFNGLLLVIGMRTSVRWPEFDILGRVLHMLVVPLSLSGLALTNLAIAVLILDHSHSDDLWWAGIALPGLISAALAISVFSQSETDEVETADAKAVKASEHARMPWKHAFRDHLKFGFAIGMMMATLAAGFPIFSLVFKVVAEAVLYHEFGGWLTLWQTAGEKMTDPLATGAVLWISMTAFFALLGLADSRLRRGRERKFRNLHRDLSPAELAPLAEAAAKVESRLDNQVSPRWLKTANGVFASGLFAIVIGSILFADDPSRGIGTSYFERSRTAGLDWYLYVDGSGNADWLALLTCCLFYAWMWQGVVFLLKQSGGGYYIRTGESTLAELYESLAVKVRTGKIDEVRAFDPVIHFMKEDREKSDGTGGFAIAAAFLTIAAFWFDRMDYTLYTDDQIIYTDYWTSRVHRASYSEVSEVTLACHGRESGRVYVTYAISIRDGASVERLQATNRRELESLVRRSLDDWERLDRKLRAAGIPFRHKREMRLGRPASKFDANYCRGALLDTLKDRRTAERVWALLLPTGSAN